MRASGKKSKHRHNGNGHTKRGPTIAEQMAAMGNATSTGKNTSGGGIPHDPNYNPVRERKKKARVEGRADAMAAWEKEKAERIAFNAELISVGMEPQYPGAEDEEYDEAKEEKEREEREKPQTATFDDLHNFIGGLRWGVLEWIAYAMLTGLVGHPKVGKSLFVLWALVRPILLGGSRPWLNGKFGVGPEKPGHVIWCDTDHSAADNVRRVNAWRLPRKRLILPFQDMFKIVDLTRDEDLKRLEHLVKEFEAPLLLLDSFRGSHNLNENDSRIGHILQAMGEIAERTGAMVLPLHHPPKGLENTEPSQEWGRGSGAWLANLRSQIMMDIPDPIVDGKRDYNRAWRRVQVLGENLGIKPEPFGFRIRPGPLTDDSIEFGPAPERPPEEEKEDGKGARKMGAKYWLKCFMELGKWYESADLDRIAGRFGIKPDTLQKAKETLGIVQPHFVRRKGKGWECSRPLDTNGEST
jgi:hypothetical protein